MKYGIAQKPGNRERKNPLLFRYPSLSRRIGPVQKPELKEKVMTLAEKDREQLRSILQSLIPEAKDGKTPSEEKLLGLISSLLPQKKKTPAAYNDSVLIERITKLEKDLVAYANYTKSLGASIREKSSRKMNHGGGHTIKDSATVTTSRNSDGTISLTAIGGFTILPATGTVNNSNVTFSFSQKPTYIVVNGQWQRENFGWTWSSPNATLAGAVGTGGDIYGIA